MLTFGDAGHGGDDTAVFQAAFDAVSGQNETLLIPVPDTSPYLVKPLFVKSDTTIQIDSGVVIQAASGYGVWQFLLTIKNATNVTISGAGAIFRMPKEEYTSGEHRHALAIQGSTNVTIQGDANAALAFNDSGGDGVYISNNNSYGTSNGSYSENVTIRYVSADNNRRNGLSVVSAQNLLVDHCSFTHSKGQVQDGIDIEPNGPEDRFVNVQINNSTTAYNTYDGFNINLKLMNNTNKPTVTMIPVDISVTNHTSLNEGKAGLHISGNYLPNSVTGKITFTNFTTENAGYRGFQADGWGATNVTFTNLTIINPNQVHNSSFTTAIFIVQPADATVPGCNIQIPSSTITQTDPLKPMKYYFTVVDSTGSLGFQHLLIAHGTWSGAVNDPYGEYYSSWTPPVKTLVTSVGTDLLLIKSVDKSSAAPGDTLTYTINYSFPTTETLTNATIEDPIPNGTTYIDGSATSGGQFDGSKITWNLGDLATGATGTVSFQIKVN